MQSISVFLEVTKVIAFLGKNADVSRTQEVYHVVYMFFGSSLCKLQLCLVLSLQDETNCVTNFRKEAFLPRPLPSHPWAALEKPILNRGKVTILIFRTKFIQKRYFRPKTEKLNTTIEFWTFELVEVENFSWNWQFYFFGPILPKKDIFGRKRKTWTLSSPICKVP